MKIDTKKIISTLQYLKEVIFHPKLKIIKWLWFGFFAIYLFAIIYFVGVIYNPLNLFGKIPSLKVLENPKSELASELYDEDGIVLGKYFRSNRTPLTYDSISSNVLNTLLATEDVRYFEHSGLDLRGMASIPFYLVMGKKKGASTISQQLAKNLFKTRKKESEGKLTNGKLGTLIIKTKEWITAARLEKAYSKKEIMSMYLNTVDFGSNSFGIKVASQTFFGKDQKYLNWKEAATLIGLLKAPTYYSPVLNPKNAIRRRNTVLGQLVKYDFINTDSIDIWKQDSIQLNYQVENQNHGIAPYFRAIASRFLRSWCLENGFDLYEDGLKIYTTINAKMQQHAENAVAKHMAYLQNAFLKEWRGYKPWGKKNKYEKFNAETVLNDDVVMTQMKRTEFYRNLKSKFGKDTASIRRELIKPQKMKVFTWERGTIDSIMTPMAQVAHHLRFLQTGFMSMDPRSGEIKAWVGGINFRHFKYDHVKQGKRQPGSCFKPIVYATVMEEAGDIYSPCYKAKDEAVSFIIGNGQKNIYSDSLPQSHKSATEGNIWTPQNAENKFSGKTYTLRQALARSINSITALMMKSLGDRTPNAVAEYAKKLGFTSEILPTPSMCLGVFDVSVYEIIGAYGTFVNQGSWTEPIYISRIEDKFGNVLEEFSPEKRKVLSDKAAYKMFYMLQGGVQEAGGTGRGLSRYKGVLTNNEVGTKTGTTQNSSDGWFMCTTPNLVTGCWVGGDHRLVRFKSMYMGQGAKMALPIVGEYLQSVYADEKLAFEKMKFQKPEGLLFNCSMQEQNDSIDLVIQKDDDKWLDITDDLE